MQVGVPRPTSSSRASRARSNHRETGQEGFLVEGECSLIVEGEERLLKRWDYFHLPARHGARLRRRGRRAVRGGHAWPSRAAPIQYLRDERAVAHDAAALEETAEPSEAYEPFPKREEGRPASWTAFPGTAKNESHRAIDQSKPVLPFRARQVPKVWTFFELLVGGALVALRRVRHLAGLVRVQALPGSLVDVRLRLRAAQVAMGDLVAVASGSLHVPWPCDERQTPSLQQAGSEREDCKEHANERSFDISSPWWFLGNR